MTARLARENQGASRVHLAIDAPASRHQCGAVLTEIAIRDLAIIEGLRLGLGAGLTVLTGETGAGKSIILGALNLLLGERASTEDLRAGASEAEVQARFELSASRSSKAFLKANDLTDADDPNHLVVRRVIAREGRSRCWINGTAVPVATLRALGDLLVDLHGQHQHQSLLDPEKHRVVLDEAGTHAAEIETVEKAHAVWSEARAAKRRLEGDTREIERRREFLQFQIQEIDAAGLRDGELAELENQRNRLRHAESLRNAAALGAERLQEGEEANALALVSEVINALQSVAEHDDHLDELAVRLVEAQANIQDIAETLRGYGQRIEADPKMLEEVDERREAIRRLIRKHGDTEADVLAQAEQWRSEVETLENRDAELERLTKEEARLAGELATAALALRAARTKASKKMTKALVKELSEVAMEKVRFEVRIETLADEQGIEVKGHGRIRVDATGMDQIEFLISPNPGEPLKPLAKIASGGELSRIMLALKAVAAGENRVPTLVFDEIDVGISGQTATRVAAKMADIAERHQILCITHLPQIAARAETHLGVRKQVKSGRTVTDVLRLEGDSRVEALALLISGDSGDAARKNAAAMLEG